MAWVRPNVVKLSDLKARELFVAKNPLFAKVFDFLDSHSLDELKQLKENVYLDGENVFLIFSHCNLRKQEDAPLEAHDKYIDLQLVLQGREYIGVRDRSECVDITEDRRSDGGDILFFAQSYEDLLELNECEYAVLPTGCAHAPAIGEGDDIKCIAKILA